MESENTAAVNEVDVSEDRIAREIAAALSEEGVNPDAPETGPETGPESPETADQEQAATSLAAYLGFGFFTLGQWLAPAWAITREQYSQLASAWSRVVVKYLPASWLRYIPSSTGGGDCVECDALAVTVAVVLPHLGTPLHSAPESEIPERQPEKPPEKPPGTTPAQADAMLDVNERGQAFG